MKKRMIRKSLVATAAGAMGAAVFVGAGVVVLALGSLVAGCAQGGSSGIPAEDGGSSMTTIARAIPPIDQEAPASFETASFAFG